MPTQQTKSRFATMLVGTWLNIMGMCVEADEAGLDSPFIKIHPFRNPANTTFAVAFQYWVQENEPLQLVTVMTTVNMELAYCESGDFRQAKVEIGKGLELLLVLNRIQYILAYSLGKPAEEVERYRVYIEKSMFNLAQAQSA